jgi:hypothetical protein
MGSVGLVVAWPASRICSRLGFSPWLGILAIVPIANVLLLWADCCITKAHQAAAAHAQRLGRPIYFDLRSRSYSA